MKLWLVGQWKFEGQPWEFQGVFDSEEKAVTACRDANYFVMPVTLNEERPHETQLPLGYYPIAPVGEEGADNGTTD